MADRFMLGWEEWLELPDLGLAAIKAKVDTGARTSALHAFSVEPIGPPDRLKVRFGVHPVPGRDDIAIMCTADVIDRREVTSSNGDRDMRYVIRSRVRMGGREWPIEITLANRETMAYRMLLGRQAILEDMAVDAASSFHQPKLSYSVYHPSPRAQADREGPRALTIALVTRRPDNASNRRIIRAAERRGHSIICFDRTRASLYIDALDPGLFVDGRPITGLDAAVIRSTSYNEFTLAVVRQMQAMGAHVVNPADALALTADPLAQRQTLAMKRVPVPDAAVSHGDLIKQSSRDKHILADSTAHIAGGAVIRYAVVGGRAVSAIARGAVSALDDDAEWQASELTGARLEAVRGVAERAARALGLGFAAVDIAETRQGPLVIDVSTGFSLAQIERLTDAAIAEALIVHIEQECRIRRSSISRP